MKTKRLITAIIVILILPTMMTAQTYSTLWKQVKEAEQNDLPKTEQEVLKQIVAKARQEQNYGQLLKAEMQHARSQCAVSPDSIVPAIEQLQHQADTESNVALKAIYNCVLGYIYRDNPQLDRDNYLELSHKYFIKALESPSELAAVKATNYEPFVIKGQDSRFFGDDLLSLIGWEARQFSLLRDFYLAAGNRRATLLASCRQLEAEEPSEMEPLNKSRHIQRLDSLINEYQDLPECGEAAICRYQFMDKRTDATDEQKWQYINMALERWGGWQRMNTLRNAQRQLSALMYEAELTEKVVIPGKSQTVMLKNLRAISGLTMNVFKVNVDGSTNLNPESSSDYKKLKSLLTALPQLTQTRQYVGKRPYELFEDSLTLEGLQPGVYMLEFESTPATHTSRCLYCVSDIRVLSQPLPDNKRRIVAVNATTGQPVKGATVAVMSGYGSERNTKKLTANEQGECIYNAKDNGNISIRAYTSEDKACPYVDDWGYFYFDDNEEPSSATAVYTDRAIYRPGQTVHVAAILYSTRNGRDHSVVNGKEVLMRLYDANSNIVGEQRAITDDFGTCTAQFSLPSKGLTGQFYIRANGQVHYFSVEEYKRPAFEVDIPRVAQNYEDGDTVMVKGTARTYAGVPVQYAMVKYKVKRTRAYWWMSYSRWNTGYIGTGSNDEIMAEGETITDDKGMFTVDVPMVLPKTKYPMFYNFVVTADVTDLAGETHQGQVTLPLGNRKTAFSAILPEKVLNEGKVKMAFHQQNMAGVDLDAVVRYRFDSGRWQETKTNKLIEVPKLKSGKHVLHAVCMEDTLEQEFVAFSIDDRRPVADTRSWFYASHEQFAMSGEPVTLQVGSSDKNVHVLYTIITGNKILESGAVDISNELINRKFKYSDEYGNGLLLTYAWIKDGKPYTYMTTIRRPMPDMNLDVKWKTFRNKLTPGQKEEWMLTVTNADGTPANAQLMATLYDKSLDQLVQHSWRLYPSVRIPLPSSSWIQPTWGGTACSGYKNSGNLSVQPMRYNHLDYDVLPSYGYGYSMMRNRMDMMVYEEASPMMMKSASMAKGNGMADMLAEAEEADLGSEEASESPEEKKAEVQIRENLQETAFFLPQLVADSTGQVNIKFTLPESLTTWRFLSIAHTRDMKYGAMADEAVARKEVMIQPNMPRFLRRDDKGVISARIVNMSDGAISGTAILQLLDPETEHVVLEQKQQVSVPDSSTVGVSFSVVPGESKLSSYTLLIARMSIITPKHSDGEQHYLPILPSTERVTVTVPFTQIAPGTKEISLNDMIPASVADTKLTVEYTNNPAWLMIQALPIVGHPHDDCAFCQVTSLYANSIGRYLLKQNPTAKHVFESWSRETAAETSLMSSLQKEQELKDLVLSETPWMMDADNEHKQKLMLAEFFDANTIDQKISSALDRLKALQNGDGSWSWWPGMKGSVYVTTSLCETMVRLDMMTGKQNDTRKMLNKGLDFLADEAVKLVNEMKKQEKKGIKQYFPSRQALQWLYICAIDGRDFPKKVTEANTYLKNLLKKDVKNQTIYEKALSAIILQNKTYVKSLKEWTVYKENMGRYYDTQRAGYSWRDYKIPTQVAAIEALKMLTPQDTLTICEMQRWLLQEKRTQAWDTPLNSIDAIFAFLNQNSVVLAPQAATVLAIDGNKLETSEATAGLGYVKTSMSNFKQQAGGSIFSASKTSSGTSWGAVYAQFTQKASEIADMSSGLSVKRELLVEGENNKLIPVDSNLKVGDKVIVRITVEADRDYDFVQIADKKAACMEPLMQLSGYDWRGGYYCSPKDNTTNYFFDLMPKGTHVIMKEYYIDREGLYQTGTCTVQCAYSPEFRGTAKSQAITVKPAK